jgi:hypothetical protein
LREVRIKFLLQKMCCVKLTIESGQDDSPFNFPGESWSTHQLNVNVVIVQNK